MTKRTRVPSTARCCAPRRRRSAWPCNALVDLQARLSSPSLDSAVNRLPDFYKTYLTTFCLTGLLIVGGMRMYSSSVLENMLVRELSLVKHSGGNAIASPVPPIVYSKVDSVRGQKGSRECEAFGSVMRHYLSLSLSRTEQWARNEPGRFGRSFVNLFDGRRNHVRRERLFRVV